MDHHMTGMTPFGMIPSSLMAGGHGHNITGHQFITEEGIFPTPDLTASHLMTESGISNGPIHQSNRDSNNMEGSSGRSRRGSHRQPQQQRLVEMTDVALDVEEGSSAGENNASTGETAPPRADENNISEPSTTPQSATTNDASP
jgi:hypothetical protein